MMLSSNKNVETIGQLIEALTRYLNLQKESIKINVVEKLVQLLTATALAIVGLMLVVAVLMFLSFAAACWLAAFVGMATAFLLVSAAHVLLLLIFFLRRKAWIERPLVRLLANMLMNDNN